MRFVRFLAVAALTLAMVTPALAAAKGKKNKGAVKGTVVEVKKDEGKETGSLVVKVTPGKKDAGAAATEKTFKITDTTKVQKLVGKKKDAVASDAKFSDVTKDANVTIVAKGEEASEVKFQVAKKAKKKAKKAN